MVSAIQKPVDISWLEKNKNSEADFSFLKRVVEYSKTSTGALRYLQGIKGVSNLTKEWTGSPLAGQIGQNAATGVAGIGLARIPAATLDAWNSLTSWWSGGGLIEAVRDVADAVTSWGNSFVFLSGNPALKQVTQWTDLTADAADLEVSYMDYGKAAELEMEAAPEVKQVYTHKKQYLMLRIAKAIVSVVSTTLAIWMVLTGMQLVPTVGMILLSLTSTCLAIRRDFFKREGKHLIP